MWVPSLSMANSHLFIKSSMSSGVLIRPVGLLVAHPMAAWNRRCVLDVGDPD